MQLTEFRHQISPLFGLSSEGMRAKQQGLYRDPVLYAQMPRRDKDGQRATAGAAGLMMLSGMIGVHPNDIAPVVRQLWEAPCISTGDVPVMKGIQLCGAGLILLLEHAALRRHLARIDVSEDVPYVEFVWKDGRLTTFAPFDSGRAYRRRVLEVVQAGMTNVAQLSGGAVGKIAALIKDEMKLPEGGNA